MPSGQLGGGSDPCGCLTLTAEAMRAKLRAGIDPIANKAPAAAPAVTPTFKEWTKTFLAGKEGGWKNEKHRAQWYMTLATYAEPLHSLPVDKIKTEDILKCLTPIWSTKHETADRTRGRIEKLLNAARVAGHIPTDAPNPARLAGHLALLLPVVKKVKKHHPALEWQRMPQFMADLRQREGIAALGLEFAILTASRNSEVTGMPWTEINLDEKLWTIPPERMKGNREHIVPLSDRAVEILKRVRPITNDDTNHVFPGERRGRGLSNMAFKAVLKRMSNGYEKLETCTPRLPFEFPGLGRRCHRVSERGCRGSLSARRWRQGGAGSSQRDRHRKASTNDGRMGGFLRFNTHARVRHR